MASNIPLPSGEGSPNYYQQQFGERIRSIRKGGGGSGGGSRWNGGAAIGIGVGVLIAILRIANSSSHHTPPPRFQSPPAFNPDALDDLDRLNKQLQDLQVPPVPFPNVQQPVMPDVPADDPNLLTEEEVPLLAGLCYRIDQESRQPQATPGKHICSLLDGEALRLLRRAAAGAELNADERNQLLDALNELLDNPKFYNAASFRLVPGVATMRLWGRDDGGNAPKGVRRFNRALLEAAYPKQIIPVRLKDNLDDDDLRAWKDRAREDLASAKKQYGSRK
jgi:hypothetical protein